MYKFSTLHFLLLLLMCASCTRHTATSGEPSTENASDFNTFDLIVDTDLGGDPDDIQSLFRLVHYSDILKVKGIVSTPCSQIKNHPWDTIPHKRLISEWIMRIDPDHLRTQGYENLMTESELLATLREGTQKPGPPGPDRSSEGARRIIEQATAYSPENPLWILVWGSMTTLAQALYESPEIAPNIRIYSIASSNTQHDSLSRNFVYAFMQSQFPNLWWIENGVLPKWSHETFRGVYQGGEQSGEWGNQAFVPAHIRGKGSTHAGFFAEKCGDVFPLATSPKNTLKEGDSPSMLYLLSPVIAGLGDVDDPTQESWGGQFRKADSLRFPNYYVDLDLPPDACQATISKWRVDFLTDWKARWDRYE